MQYRDSVHRFAHDDRRRRQGRFDRSRHPSRGGMGEHPDGHDRRGNTRKRLSQNFLTDPQIAATVARRSGVESDDAVIEVGPGRGILTRALQPLCREITAYELDPKYAKLISEKHRDDPKVTCHNQDFLTVPAPREAFRLVANIPYSRTSDIIDWCLATPTLKSATLITQWEYARKRTGDYGRWSRLTVLSWPQVEWRLLGRVDRRKFNPVPSVDSGILHLERRKTPLLVPFQQRDFEEMVRLGFTGIGGDIFRSLRQAVSTERLRQAFRDADVNPRAQVGYVSPQEWLRLYDSLMS